MFVRSCRNVVPDVGQSPLLIEGDLTVNPRSHWSVRLVLLLRWRSTSRKMRGSWVVGPDEHRERCRSWQSVSSVVIVELSDFPVERPRAVQWVVESFPREGHDPVTWPEKTLAVKRFSETDRPAYPLRLCGHARGTLMKSPKPRSEGDMPLRFA